MARCLLARKSILYRKITAEERNTSEMVCLLLVECPKDAPAVDIPWNQSSMSHHDLNMLSLCDCIRKCYDDHLRYRRHLYLDRNQSYGEIELNRTSRFIAKLDYMMKLRAKQYNADTSIFHLMMSKGCSVHVFCFKGRIDDERLGEMRSNDAFTSMVQVSDYVLIWIDTFGTDTTQGGYETLCVEDSCLRKLKEICPWVEDEIDFMSDAGSGYKSSQTLLGLRNIKHVTGIRVRYVHLNASGEGKRWETDGNTDIKVRRENAMRAGQPIKCNTPASEVEAQLFNGGIEGSCPTLLELNYKEKDCCQHVGRYKWVPRL